MSNHLGGENMYRLGSYVVLGFGLILGSLLGYSQSSEPPVNSTPGVVVDPLSELAVRWGMTDGADSMAAQRLQAQISLDALVAIAKERHPQMTQAKAKLTGSQNAVESAKSQFHPTASLGGSLSKGKSWDLDADVASSSTSQNVSVSAGENLFNGGNDFRNLKIAHFDEAAQRIRLEESGESIAYSVRQAALTFQKAAVHLGIRESSLRDAERLLDISQKKQKAGLVGKIDVFRAQGNIGSARSAVAAARMDKEEARIRLYSALGVERADGTIAGLMQQVESIGLVTLAQTNDTRPPSNQGNVRTYSERVAAMTTEQSELRIANARSSRWLPKADISASLGQGKSQSASDATDVTSDSSSRSLSLGLSLSWPLYSAQAGDAITGALNDRIIAQAQAESARISALHERELARQKLESLSLALAQYAEAFRLQDKLYDMQESLYRAGNVELTVVIENESQRVTALGQWYDALIQWQLARLSLEALERGYVAGGAGSS